MKNATILATYLIAKFNTIKRSRRMLSEKEIQSYIEEFKNINYENIINRNSYLNAQEIDSAIKELSHPVDIQSPLIQKELYELMQMLKANHDLDSVLDFSTEDAQKFKDYIVQIKINALNDVKKTLTHNLPQTEFSTPYDAKTNGKTIKDAVQEYLDSKTGVSKATLRQITLNLNYFMEYVEIKGLTLVDALKHKDLIDFRTYRQKVSPKTKSNTLNITLTNLATFIKFCVKSDYIQKDIAIDIKVKRTVKEKMDSKREVYTDEHIKKIFDNIELLTHSPTRKVQKKNYKEFPLIIKIAMYTGMREDEICSLTKADIKQENNIYYFDINIEDGKNIKNISSIRKVPIHPSILEDVLEYVKSIKRNKLFLLTASNFSTTYGIFKNSLGFSRKLVFHSFRNTLQDKLKQAKVQNMIINEITGHSSSADEKMTDTYTNKYNLELLYEELLKVKYEY